MTLFAPAPSVPAVKGYLFDRMAARVEFAAPVQVQYDEPGPNQQNDIVALLDVEESLEPHQMVGNGGQGWLHERYTQQVVVSVFRGGDDARLVFERCAELVAVVIDVVRLDPSLGGLVNVDCYPSTVSYTSEWNVSEDELTGEQLHLGRTTAGLISLEVSNTL